MTPDTIVETKFMTVESLDLSGVGKNDSNQLYLIFKSGATHSVVYNDQKECEADFDKLSNAMKNR